MKKEIKIKASKKILVIAAVISFCYALFLISPVLSTIFKTPARTVNLLVGHYFEDYFEYLSFIKQGQKGSLLLENVFSSEEKAKFLIPWWPYLLIGLTTFVTGINVEAQHLYWFSSFVFAFIFLLLNFWAVSLLLPDKPRMQQVCAFLFIILSAPLFSIDKAKNEIVPYDFWYGQGSPFSRFSVAVPHHQLTNIIFLLAIILLALWTRNEIGWRKRAAAVIVSCLLLLVSSPPMLILFFMSYFSSWLIASMIVSSRFLPHLSFLKKYYLHFKKNLEKDNCFRFSESLGIFVVSVLTLLPSYLILKKLFLSNSTIIFGREFDRLNYIYYPPVKSFIYNYGLLLLSAPFAVLVSFSRITFAKLLFFCLTLLSISFSMINIVGLTDKIYLFLGFHNLRMLSPTAYIFLGTALLELIDKIFKKKTLFFLAVIIILAFNLPSAIVMWQRNSLIPFKASYLQSMPQDIYLGIKFLEKQKSEGIILTSPNSLLGVAIPAIAGKKVYLGRSIFTFDLVKKQEVSNRFYSLKMTQEEAQSFLKKENISLVVLVKGYDLDKDIFSKQYPFLKTILASDNLTIFQVR